MSGKQHAVMWLGLTLILTRLFTTNQWSNIWGLLSSGGGGGKSGTGGGWSIPGGGTSLIPGLPPAGPTLPGTNIHLFDIATSPSSSKTPAKATT